STPSFRRRARGPASVWRSRATSSNRTAEASPASHARAAEHAFASRSPSRRRRASGRRRASAERQGAPNGAPASALRRATRARREPERGKRELEEQPHSELIEAKLSRSDDDDVRRDIDQET